MISVHIEGRGRHLVAPGSRALALLEEFSSDEPGGILTLKINGQLADWGRLLQEGDQIQLLTFSDHEGKQLFWHSSAHVLAQAVLRLYPDALATIGPPIDQGFYYDFANLKISDEALGAIQQEMERICREDLRPERTVLDSKAQAKALFKSNPYKLQLIDGFDEVGEVSAYRQGEFVDLCRGPHLATLGVIKAVKILKISGAYWRGDSKNEMLTRIYAITFPTPQQLEQYVEFLQEAQKRDHKILGPQLDLFSLHEEAPGLPFMHPKGMLLWNRLLEFWRALHQEAGYVEIKTPTLMSRELWQISGHWQNYRANMYTTSIEERDFAIKPMNCPGCMLYYKSRLHSYRDLPLRIAEIGLVHRYEASGALSGLFRVRGFHQDDAHLFVKPQEIHTEVAKVLDLVERIYSTFGLSYHLELSTRPASHTIGTDEQWQTATEGLQQALELVQKSYKLNPGDGAFYGPKIDVHIKDAIGRTWQCATIQLDMALPERFDLDYTDSDGQKKRPVMLHRAIFGSVERFLGILIEHFKGRFPLWISPYQIRLLPIADKHLAAAEKLALQLQERGFVAEVDGSHESVGKRIRNAQLLQVNYMLTLGDRELEQSSLSVRTREGKVFSCSFEEFVDKISQERASRALHTLF